MTARCLLAVLLAGCYPVTGLQGPRTTPAGRLHGAVAFAVSPTGNPNPTPDVSLRYGLSDRVDVGMRMRMAAFEAGPKIQLVRDDVEVSFAPVLLVASDQDGLFDETTTIEDNVKVVAERTSVYVGSSMDRDFAAFVAPTLDVGERRYNDPEGDLRFRDLLLAPGVLTGILFGTSSSVRALLEVGLLVPVGGRDTVTNGVSNDRYQTRLGPGDTRIEIGLGLMFGSYE